ncbi:lamin tail domain-containing protein [Sandaracinus amylolyticus]|uniref:LTD domain-containing protein n=1 Tax=Sandaracinus amylolyticus TaxID=927083 RepID=A0A0F6W5C1_9BACT|nr:lamin tail domain-containing protein [Sandaracinus amylolyticus]AKF07881.1 hypothetical protein DB32_005030 [Sandaracinus amylolyticus]
MRTSALLHTLSLALSLSGCFELPPPPPPRDAALDAPLDAAEPLRIVSVAVLDALGNERSMDAIPRSARIVIDASATLEGEPDPLVLVAQLDPEVLREDLESAPLRSETLARVVACERITRGATIELRPRVPLAPGTTLHLGIASWARDEAGRRLGTAFVQTMHVDPSELGGARVVSTWPPEGASAVSADLPLAAVRFDGAVSGIAEGVWIEGPSGERVPGDARAARCDEIGWEGAHCAVIVPSRPLAPSAIHALRTDERLLDATGASVPATRAPFETGREPDLDPPEWLATACALDERPSDAGCVLADDRRIVLRLRGSEPVRVRMTIGDRILTAVAPRGETELAIDDLGPSATIHATLDAIDLAGTIMRTQLELSTTDALAPISIVEVRADPWSVEPRQEYVEIANLGAVTIDLAGFSLSDAPGSMGDVIVGPARVAPGARALIVADAFDPDDRGEDDRDVAIPPGVALIRVDRSLASGGLANSGEPLFLRDPDGRRVSAMPAEPTPRAGVCTVRVADDPRTGARGSFDYDAAGGCTPGR